MPYKQPDNQVTVVLLVRVIAGIEPEPEVGGLRDFEPPTTGFGDFWGGLLYVRCPYLMWGRALIPTRAGLEPGKEGAMEALGRQILVEFFDCDREKLNSVEDVKNAMVKAADESGATIVESVFHHFSPHGVSGVVVIAESHLAIHTWPEYGYAAGDLFTCGESVDPTKALELLKNAFGAKRFSTQEIQRGIAKDIGLADGQKFAHKPVSVPATGS